MRPTVGFVFIHGGEHGAWCWDRVRARLLHPSVAVDLPRRGDDRAADLGGDAFLAHAEAAVAATQWEHVILAAHSLGGVTACRLVEASNRIVHVVFVACMIPPHGGRPIDDAPWYLRRVVEWGARSAVRRTGTYQLPTPIAKYLFCNDLSNLQTEEFLRRRCPEPARVILEPFTAIVPAEVSRTWIQPLRDRAIPVRTQRRIIERIGGADVVKIDAGHDVMISRPAEVADVLNRIAGGYANSLDGLA